MVNFAPSLLGFVAFFSIGLICLAWPERVQNGIIRFYSRHRTLAKFGGSLRWVRTPYYLIKLRFVGIVSLAASLILLLIILDRVLMILGT
jgi:hypothetical protein